MACVIGILKGFPFVEGVGIFLGLLALDFLLQGYIEVTRPALLALLGAFVLFGLRCRKAQKNQE